MIANIIAGVSLLLSISLAFFYFRDRRHAKYQVETAYIDNLLKWHSDVVNLLVALREEHIRNLSAESKKKLSKLSSLIEQGRFFFPNIDRNDGHGKDKPPAYRGYRNLALDFLVASYKLFNRQISNDDLEKALILQRHFTSIVFEIVRPKDRLETIKALTDRYFVQEKSFEDFLTSKDSLAIEYIWH